MSDETWQKTVYGRSPTEYIDNLITSLKYDEIKPQVFRRDNYRCRRCKTKPGAKLLSAHHVIPRDVGGQTELHNMITLCFSCHDFVEIKDYRSINEIENRDLPVNADEVSYQDYEASRPHWHSWVYGGAQRPA